MARRREVFARAQARALEIGRPLVVVGNPDGGFHTRFQRGYSCGNICVDLTGCPACPVSIQADITKGIPEVADDAAVVFVSCVLEVVDDVEAAERELLRIAGTSDNIFPVYVGAYSFTAFLYNGAQRRATPDGWAPVTKGQVALAAGAAGLSLFVIGATLASVVGGKR